MIKIKKATLIFLLLITGIELFGQTNQEKNIIGSWEHTGYEYKKKFNPTSTSYILSFYSDSIYQKLYSNNNSDSLNVKEAGNWEINKSKNILILKNSHLTPNLNCKTFNYSKFGIIQITDSILKISAYEGKHRIFLCFKRIISLPQIIDNFKSPIQTQTNSISPKHSFYLINSFDTSKKINITDINIDLTLNKTFSDTLNFKTKEIEINGLLHNYIDSTVSLIVYTESINLELKNGFSSQIYNTYSDANEIKYQDFNFKEIDDLNFSNPKLEFWNNLSVVLTSTSYIALIIAPLVNVNFKNDSFNSKGYYYLTGASLIGLSTGISLSNFAGVKKYKITNDMNKSDKHYWHLIKK